jgi:hypothetical protein
MNHVAPAAVQMHMPEPMAVDAPPPLPPGALRRQLRAELEGIERVLAESPFHDEKTELIRAWRQRFVEALRLVPNEEEVLQEYIPLMQRLLCNPGGRVPLDEDAVLGSDGRTYGQMYLDVYRASVAAAYRNRSPVEHNNPRELAPTPHPVVRHMIGWLRDHGALRFSAGLRARHAQLLPQIREMDRQERIERIRARQAALNEREAAQREENVREFEQGIDARFNAMQEEINRRLAPLNERLGGVQAGVDAQAAQGDAARARLRARLDAMAERRRQMQAGVDAAAEEDQAGIDRIHARIEELLRGGFEQIAAQIDAFAANAEGRIHEVEEADRHAAEQFAQRMEGIRAELNRLEEENRGLEQNQRNVGAQLGEARQQVEALQHAINETRSAIDEAEKRDSDSLFKTIAIIGVSIFATWAVGAMLAGTSWGATIGPWKDGIKFTATKSF